jgi:ubiquitin-protein ligase
MAIFDDDPRTRRLKADFEAMKRLKDSSTILDFNTTGDPPERYVVTFKGRSVKRKAEDVPVEIIDTHRVEIQLGIDYPRSQPYLKWLTELYHPNIAISGAVCLGGYSTNWVPSLALDQLCEMLWDMLRYSNYDVTSPYNYRAAQWAKSQTQIEFPCDPRPLRDKALQTQGGNVIKLELTKAPEPAKPAPAPAPAPAARPQPAPAPRPAAPPPRPAPRPSASPSDDVIFIDGNDAPPAPAQPVRRPAAPPAPRPSPGGDDGISFVE